MSCIFSLCDFYNVVIGGIVIGIISSLLFVWLTSYREKRIFKRKYQYLNSPNGQFDWISYSMKDGNGRKRSENPNGSTASLTIKDRKINIVLKHDGRKWLGQIQMLSFGFGLLSFKYENEHEYGRRECIIGSYNENGQTYDYLFLIPIEGKIYYIENQGERLVPKYEYGNEMLVRHRNSV